MAEAAVLRALLTLKDEFSAQLGKAKGELGTFRAKFEEHRKAIGIGMVAVGGAITGLAALSIKSAQTEAIGISRLDQALKNVGQSYAALKEPIEAVIEAQQRKTSFGDDAQRDALQKLLTISGQYEASLKALPVVLDVAAGANIDLQAAALLVGKALAGETSALSRYGILLKEGASQAEIMAALTRQFAGAAEAAADPFKQLQNRVGDLMDEVGKILLPIVTQAVQILTRVAEKVIAWTQAHPGLTKAIVIATAAIGGLVLVGGSLLLLLPALISGFAALGVVIHLALGPVGLITLAIAGLVAAALLLWRHWDKVWQGIQVATQAAANAVLRGVEWMANAIIAALNALIETANKVAQTLSVGLAPELGRISEVHLPRLSLAAKNAQKGVEQAAEGMKEAVKDAAGNIQEKVLEMSEGVKGIVNDMGSAIEKALNLMYAEEEREALGNIDEQERIAQAGAKDRIVVIDDEIRQWRDIMEAWRGDAKAAYAHQQILKLEAEKQGILASLTQAETGFDQEREARKTHFEALREVAREESLKLLQDLDQGQQDALELLAKYNPNWWQQGVSYADALIGGLESKKAEVDATVALLMSSMKIVAEGATALIPTPIAPPVMIEGVPHPPGHPGPSAFPPGAQFRPMPGMEARTWKWAELLTEAQRIWPNWEEFGKELQDKLINVLLRAGLEAVRQWQPALQQGGIVSRPTLALVGERGPEAIIPLQGGRMGNTLNIIFNAPVYGLEDFKRKVAEAVRDTALGGGFYGVLAPAR